MPIKTKQKKKGKKRQNRPSEIRLSGVPPIMPIKHQKPKKNQGQNRPSEIRFTGVPPIMPIKNISWLNKN